MNSPPERLTPSRRRVAPLGSVSRLPLTLSSGALVGGVVVGEPVGVGAVVGVVVGVGEELPAQARPLRVNPAGAGLSSDEEAMRPRVTLAPFPSEPFQLSLVAVTLLPDWDHVAPQPWVMCWPPVKSKPRFQPPVGVP